MKLGVVLKILVVGSLGLSALAGAQTGTRIGPPPAAIPDTAKNNGQLSRQAIRGFAECTVRKDRARVERFLATITGTPEAEKLGRALSTDDCLSRGEIRFNEQLLRWSFYDLLYRQRFAGQGPVDFSAYPPFDLNSASARSQSGALMEMGDCIVRKSGAGARELALSPVTTTTEDRAFAALMPMISACVPKDSQVVFSKIVLRGLIVEALYTMSSNAGSAAAAGSVAK